MQTREQSPLSQQTYDRGRGNISNFSRAAGATASKNVANPIMWCLESGANTSAQMEPPSQSVKRTQTVGPDWADESVRKAEVKPTAKR